jgi:hypothetical protein
MRCWRTPCVQHSLRSGLMLAAVHLPQCLKLPRPTALHPLLQLVKVGTFLEHMSAVVIVTLAYQVHGAFLYSHQ